MTDAELKDIEAALAALPPRPWKISGTEYDEDCEPHPIAWGLEAADGDVLWSSGAGEYSHPDLATGTFIACGPDTIAALVAEVRKLRMLLAAYEGGAEERKAHLDRVWWDALHQASREGLDLSETVRRADIAREREQQAAKEER